MSHSVSPDCIFCKIASSEIPSAKIYEDEDVFAFLDLRPSSKGHTLVIPKNHSTNVLETPDAELSKIILAVKKMAGALVAATGAKGFNVSVNNGAEAGQVVFHLHFHIIPRYFAGPLKPKPSQNEDDKILAELVAQIKPFIK